MSNPGSPRGLLVVAATLLSFAGLAAPAPAQSPSTGTVVGVVVDATTGLTLAGAAVHVDGGARAVISDDNGRFAVLGVPVGRREVVASYLGYGAETRSVDVPSGAVAGVRFQLSTAAIEVEGVTVTGQRVGQAAALNQQLNAPNVTNVVASDQIGRFPDANIGDAMKRIPGIQVLEDQGEARFGIIRGTEPQLNSVTLNGERIPSAEAEIRSVQLDLIPSDMVSAIEVNKVLTPDMDADAIGASVNIVTRSAPDSRRLSATLGSGYNLLEEKPMGIASGVYAQRFADDRLGLVLNASYYDHKLGSDDVEATWDGSDADPWVSEVDMRRYDVQRTRRSVGASLDLRLGEGSTLFYRGMYNHRDDWENRYRTRWQMDEPDASGVQVTAIRKQLKIGVPGNKDARLEDQRTQAHQLSGEHIVGRARLDWSLEYARASEQRPNERYLEFRNKKGASTVDISDPREPFVMLMDASAGDPASLGFNELTEENQWTKDVDENARIDLTLPVGEGGTELRFGGRFRDKSKLRDNDFFQYEPLSGLDDMAETTLADYDRSGDFLAGSRYKPGMFTTKAFGGSLDLENAALFEKTSVPEEFIPANFDAGERIAGGYVSLTRTLGARTSLLAGVRVEHTSLDYTGYSYDIDTEGSTATMGSDTYTNVFPSAIFRFDLGSRRVLRAAWSNTIARPNYYDLVPYRAFSREDSELALGNPDLKPTKSMNLDLMFEQYYASVGMFSAGIYYKDISDFIYGYTRTDAVDAVSGESFHKISQPQNGASATLYGFEVAFQRSLVAGLSVYGNYSYTSSSVDGFPIAGRTLEDLPLPGTSKHAFNASLGYDDSRFTFRASVNFQDDFLDPDEGVGDSAFYDRWYDRATHVDLNGEVALTPQARFFFEANNLTNQPLRYYQGTRERTMQGEYYNARFQSGIKVDFR